MGGPTQAESAPSVIWRVFGGVRCTVDGSDLALGHRAKRLLGALLLDPTASQTTSNLAGEPGEKAATAVRVAINRLRSQLRAAGAGDPLVSTPAGYRLDVEPTAVDHLRFRIHLDRASSMTWPQASLREIDDALLIWEGEPFGDLADDELFENEVAALEEMHRLAVDRWCDLALRCGLDAEAIPRLQRFVEVEPLREQRWYALVLALYRSGRQADALRAYHDARRTLIEQVGVEPGPALRALEGRILEHDPLLRWHPETRMQRPRPLRPAAVTLGRGDEVLDVLDLIERRRVVVITGLGGMGKTTVAGEVALQCDKELVLTCSPGPARSARALLEALGDAIEVNSRLLDSASLLDAVVERMRGLDVLLVLDGCEHLPAEIAELSLRLIDRLPRLHILATSRVDLAVPGAATFTLGPLSLGTVDAPGAAALLLADAAGIGRSQLAARWDEVVEAYERSGGIPLAIELWGSVLASGSVDAMERADDPLAGAVVTALRSLPPSTVALLMVVAGLPDAASDHLLARLTERPLARVRAEIGEAVRIGLALRTTSTHAQRVRLLDPVREQLVRDWRDDQWAELVALVTRTAEALGREAAPSPIAPRQLDAVTLLDHENTNVRWAIESTRDPKARLEAALDVAMAWRCAERTIQTETILVELEPFVAALGRDSRSQHTVSRYWVMRAQASPSLATRVDYMEQLAAVVASVDEHGDCDLAARAACELAIARGWSGDLAAAGASLQMARTLVSDPGPWAEVSVASLEAMADAVAGDPAGAGRRLAELAHRYDELGAHHADGLSNLYIASTFLRIAGDDDGLDRLFREATRYERHPYGRYAWSALLFERARLAVKRDQPSAGVMLHQAFEELRRHGEHRTAEVCRRELGRWRLAQGDEGGLADIARSASLLRTVDPKAAAVALAVLAAHDRTGIGDRLAAAAVGHADAPGGVPLDREERALVDAVRDRAADAVGEVDLDDVLRGATE